MTLRQASHDGGDHDRIPADGSSCRRGVLRAALVAILLLAAALRLPGLDKVPPPLNQDEASRGYDAWSLWTTGRDRHGRAWPMFLESFGPGDFTAALSTYCTMPFVAVLGPTPLAMRLPAALLGLATVAAVFLWLRREVGAAAALTAAGVLACDPWHVALTRTAHESGFAPAFLAAAMWAASRGGVLPRWREDQTPGPQPKPSSAGWSIASGVLLGLHAWVYPATRLLTPLLCGVALVIFHAHWRTLLNEAVGRRRLLALTLGLSLGLAPLLVTAAAHPERLAARAEATLVTRNAESPWAVTVTVARHWAANLNPLYWFHECDEMSGATIPRVGLHLPVLAPLFALGLWQVLATCRSREWSRFLLAWLLLFPLPAAICGDWNPHPLRTVGGMLLFPVFCGLGATWIAARRPSPGWRPLLAAVLLAVMNLAHFVRTYYAEFPYLCRPGYQNALYEATAFVARQYPEAEQILVTNYSNQPYIYALLLEPIAPAALQAEPPVIVGGRLGFHQVLEVGRYLFMPRDDVDGAVPRFQALLAERRARSRGPTLLIDVDRPDLVIEAEPLARFAVGDPRVPGQVLVVYRLPDQVLGSRLDHPEGIRP